MTKALNLLEKRPSSLTLYTSPRVILLNSPLTPDYCYNSRGKINKLWINDIRSVRRFAVPIYLFNLHRRRQFLEIIISLWLLSFLRTCYRVQHCLNTRPTALLVLEFPFEVSRLRKTTGLYSIHPVHSLTYLTLNPSSFVLGLYVPFPSSSTFMYLSSLSYRINPLTFIRSSRPHIRTLPSWVFSLDLSTGTNRPTRHMWYDRSIPK